MSTNFEHISYNLDSATYDTRELNVYCGNDGVIVDIGDYTTMNEFGSQRNEGSMRISLNKEKTIELRDTLLKAYPAD